MTGLTKAEEKKILSAKDKITAGVELMVETPLHFIKCILMKHEKAALEVMKELHERAEKTEAELAEAKRENEEARDIHNSNMNRYAERAEAAESRCSALEADALAEKELHMDLIMQVARKWPNESRHETAKRYIVEAENRPCTGPAQVATKGNST